MRKVLLEQKSQIERLSKKEAENQQTIEIFVEYLKASQVISLSCLRFHPLVLHCDELCIQSLFCVPDLLASRPTIDEISTNLAVLQDQHECLQASLKESHLNDTKLKKELEIKHEQAMSEMVEKLKTNDNRFKTLAAKLKSSEAEAVAIDNIIFRKKSSMFVSPPCVHFSPITYLETD
jgi:DNA repair exonuclease SbcCD ATPase subunit